MAIKKKKSTAKKTSGTRKTVPARKTSGTAKKNKLGVKNSLVNNINARKKRGTSRSKRQTTVSQDAYETMENNWDRS